jgi:hypothetical protein
MQSSKFSTATAGTTGHTITGAGITAIGITDTVTIGAATAITEAGITAGITDGVRTADRRQV